MEPVTALARKDQRPIIKEPSMFTRNWGTVTKNRGMLLLSIYLIASGIIPLLHLSFANMDIVLAVLAIAAGVFILIGR